MNYEEVYQILNKIHTSNEDEEFALTIAKELCKKEIPLLVEVNVDHMDENCNDYYYTCANCGNTIYSENEWVCRCDCGQVIKSLRFDDWNPDFLRKNKWDQKEQKWVPKRKKKESISS